MHLNDAWDTILDRKADEAPGGIAPLNYVWTAPGYDPATAPAPVEAPAGTLAPQQITITAKKIPPPPAPIQIPILKPVVLNYPIQPNPWDQITANRAAMVTRQQSSWTRYLPWILGAAAAAVLLAMAGGDKRKAPAAPARRRPSVRRPVSHSYARARRR